ncbi:siderophore ABC transporter substrate-binding protein [Pseudomonas sp. MF6772]|uniref:siderophore ABC transporter substrate-binding protein n=1 Tax=Pseudomonas TaxID=286 RepID=UPI000E0677A9|nr:MULTISPECIES: siderophore ABC transporter substrate-binding protein [Pseudomonas]SUD44587.1 ferric siderophore ABC transporter, periplasmic siderophore-binding protein [Pseudomonas fluorescens]MBJ2267187.1 siderophore ABC transporter substrate-binding protein [Pseudomonas sp. MF6772]MBL7227575.1 siderophore ABC transporter substrate-binding protein [Pseudomonas sp.]MCU0213003.1 siderophore ABC transporter substrate-binding protein [Pseudomonas shahriarae]NMY18737.1 siderophore ABC transport
MSTGNATRCCGALLAIAIAAGLQGCDKPAAQATPAATAQAHYQPIKIEHPLGTTLISKLPERVVAFDMSELDTLDQLGAPVVGIAKDYVASFLVKYRDDPNIMDVGTTIQPNLERLHALKPDLILISPLQAQSYAELSQIAPTVYDDVDLTNQHGNFITTAKNHLTSLGRIFGKEELARQKVAQMDAKVEQTRRVTEGRPEKALIVLHNNGAFTSYGVKSRYGFVFDTLGVKPASSDIEAGLHGQPISNEFIQQADPDILYVIDRTAVMERRPALDLKSLDNPLLRKTKAWSSGRVIFVDAQTWYLCTASVTCLDRMADEVVQGYKG